MYKQIAKLSLEELKSRLHVNEIEIDYDDELVDYLYQHSYNPEFGARPIKRYIQDHIENAIAYFMLENDTKAMRIMVENDKIVVKAN